MAPRRSRLRTRLVRCADYLGLTRYPGAPRPPLWGFPIAIGAGVVVSLLVGEVAGLPQPIAVGAMVATILAVLRLATNDARRG